jgi:hypothetical protein
VPEPGETLIRSDEVASILVYRDGRPIKIIYPDGRVEPFARREMPQARVDLAKNSRQRSAGG